MHPSRYANHSPLGSSSRDLPTLIRRVNAPQLLFFPRKKSLIYLSRVVMRLLQRRIILSMLEVWSFVSACSRFSYMSFVEGDKDAAIDTASALPKPPRVEQSNASAGPGPSTESNVSLKGATMK